MKKLTDTKKDNTEHLEGVFSAVKKNGEIYYRASLTYRRKHISLGSFPTSTAAKAAYLEACRILRDMGVTLHSYPESSPISFSKWVSLLNFRDNGIYCGNPIYITKKLFYYYLSPAHVLKFDPDDLFYYASHKIMCRGKHYFVTDHGSQVSIVTRYGIKPYAVEGRDFRFINGDSNDFRRENLEVINRYYGVTLEYKNGQYYYTVRIHINGNYLVGRYSSETEAAIAYNKAADILKKNGVTKNYPQNYIEELSPRKYAEIYTSLHISPHVMEYHS